MLLQEVDKSTRTDLLVTWRRGPEPWGAGRTIGPWGGGRLVRGLLKRHPDCHFTDLVATPVGEPVENSCGEEHLYDQPQGVELEEEGELDVAGVECQQEDTLGRLGPGVELGLGLCSVSTVRLCLLFLLRLRLPLPEP